MWSIRLALVIVIVLMTMTSLADASKLYTSSKDYEDLMKRGIWTFGQTMKILLPSNIFAFNHGVDDAVYVYPEDVERQDANNTCFKDIRLVQDALNNQTFWAIKMVDASSKIPPGLLEGNVIDLGQYDGCLNARGTWKEVEIQGRPCAYTPWYTGMSEAMVFLQPMLTICVPETCEPEDLMLMFNRMIDTINEQIKKVNETIGPIPVTVSSVSCSDVDGNVWDTWFIVCLTIFLIIVSFLLACTFCDVGLRQLTTFNDENTTSQDHSLLVTLSKFSLMKSAAAILSTRVKQDSLPAIHGIRFISMAWIVLGHQYFSVLIEANVNMLRVLDWADSWSSLYIIDATFAVDTFLAISGFLMAYLFLKQMSKQKYFNLAEYYLHRYLRLTPMVLVLIIFSLVFLPKMSTGPRWDVASTIVVKKCSRGWWPIILYVQNFVEPREICLGHLWYLAVDMQLFWISPIILYPLYRKPKLGLVILALLMAISIAVPAAITGYNEYPTVSYRRFPDLDIVMDAFESIYIKPYCRASPWLIGIYFGYEVATKNRKLSKHVVHAGWALCIAALAFCVFGMRYFMQPNYEYQPILETFYSVFSRTIWGFGVCWIIFASVNNQNGLVTKLLNWKYFLPLSRLSYCVYLVHFVLQVMIIGSTKVPSYFSDFNVWHTYLANLILCYIIAFFFSLLIESPLLVLEGMVLGRKRESHSESRKNLTQNGVKGSSQEVYR